MNSIIQERFNRYACQNIQEEDFAAKEITQELVLFSLYQADFFKEAAFQGGTALRIVYQINRFSEDLDFVLVKPNVSFDLNSFMPAVISHMKVFGYELQIKDRKDFKMAVKGQWLKENSVGKIVQFKHTRDFSAAVHIKIEVDSNPPAGALFDAKFLDFPIDYQIRVHDLPSLFAGKCHALLARTYEKGRDWFDFSWYVARDVKINFNLLSQALMQSGHLVEENEILTKAKFVELMQKKIQVVNWQKCQEDVHRFLKPADAVPVKLWGKDFFLSKLEKLKSYL